ncbi:MAG: TIGR04211 family SH3 domain-containing protein [Halioglobus sp.]
MQRVFAFFLLLLTFWADTTIADTRYVSDKQFIPLRSGPGGNYRITHRGIPSGTQLEVSKTSENGEYAEITTVKGTQGWIRTQYLMTELPAQNKVDAAEQKAASLAEQNRKIRAESKALKQERAELLTQVKNTSGSLDSTTEELAQLKAISGKAVQLNTDNSRLVLESEELRSEVETLEAENQRLQDKLESEAFMDGAIAVLLGVIIALVVPRLWPTRRKNSSWA